MAARILARAHHHGEMEDAEDTEETADTKDDQRRTRGTRRKLLCAALVAERTGAEATERTEGTAYTEKRSNGGELT